MNVKHMEVVKRTSEVYVKCEYVKCRGKERVKGAKVEYVWWKDGFIWMTRK